VMSEPLGRLSSIFVEPAPRRARPAARVTTSLSQTALLCAPEDARALGSAVALSFARRARSPVGLLLLWRPGGPSATGLAAPVTRRARLLAGSLRARDLRVTAGGRLVRVDLPDEPEAATAAAGHAEAAADAPAVFACAGPRTDALDDLLADRDLLLLAAADPDSPLTSLALESLAELGPAVAALPTVVPPVSRALALAGLSPPTTVSLPEPAC
jgi:hypothetical protein